MKLIARLAAALVLGGMSIPHHVRFAASGWAAERTVLSRAAVALGHHSVGSVIAQLQHDPIVQSAGLGSDGKTVTVDFRSGLSADLVSPGRSNELPGTSMRTDSAMKSGTAGAGRRALVLEPFAEEMGLGPSAGDSEAQALRDAGTSVDEIKDADVTVDELRNLSRYDVVYMQTHIGVNQWGEAVVVSGQPATGDPSLQPLIQSHEVFIAGIWGSTQLYYGILSAFIRDEVPAFRPGALLILNGCSLLQAPLFWNALRDKGAATLVSWDGESGISDEAAAGNRFVQDMASGMTVDAAMADIKGAGMDVSYPAGMPAATFGYVGNGSLTLSGASAAPTPTPLPATATATPAPTGTLVPAIRRLHRACAWLTGWNSGTLSCRRTLTGM